MKKNTLYNEPFDHERYERDTDTIMVATGVIFMIAICSIIYIIGAALMG